MCAHFECHVWLLLAQCVLYTHSICTHTYVYLICATHRFTIHAHIHIHDAHTHTHTYMLLFSLDSGGGREGGVGSCLYVLDIVRKENNRYSWLLLSHS